MTETAPLLPGLNGPTPSTAAAILSVDVANPDKKGSDFLQAWTTQVATEDAQIEGAAALQIDSEAEADPVVEGVSLADEDDPASPQKPSLSDDESLLVLREKTAPVRGTPAEHIADPELRLHPSTERSLDSGPSPMTADSKANLATAQMVLKPGVAVGADKSDVPPLKTGQEGPAVSPIPARQQTAELRFLADVAVPKTPQASVAPKAEALPHLGKDAPLPQVAIPPAGTGTAPHPQPTQITAPSASSKSSAEMPAPSLIAASNLEQKTLDHPKARDSRFDVTAQHVLGQRRLATPVQSNIPLSMPAQPPINIVSPTPFTPQGDGGFDLLAPEGEAFVTSATTTTALATRGGTIHPMQQHAPQAAQQIATATVQSQTGKTEIALNPEELGRVRMALTSAEGGISVSIIAERPETADLLRRNIELLMREFRDLGYATVDFSFGDRGDGPASDTDDTSDNPHAPTSATTGPHPEPLITTVALSGGLDLKL